MLVTWERELLAHRSSELARAPRCGEGINNNNNNTTHESLDPYLLAAADAARLLRVDLLPAQRSASARRERSRLNAVVCCCALSPAEAR